MTSLLQRYATPLIAGLFLVSLISGIALFFHVGNALFHGMHEWISMVLIVPFLLHVLKNWPAMKRYFTRAPFTIAMVLSLSAALAFAIPSGKSSSGGPPQAAFAHAMLANSPAKLAPLLGTTPEILINRLKAAGFAAVSSDQSLVDIASRSGRDDFELLTVLLPATP